MNKVALVISNRVRKVPGGIVSTEIDPLIELGYETYWAADFSIAKFDLSTLPCPTVQVSFRSNPFHPKNISAYKTLVREIRRLKPSIVYCQTPIGGLLGRLAARRVGVPCVIYEAHGFLFFKNGPRLGFFYRMVERWLARYTDFLLTINEEDFRNASMFSCRQDNAVHLVHGSGMDLDFTILSQDQNHAERSRLGFVREAPIILSVGELNSNKNVETFVRAISLMRHYEVQALICGEGSHAHRLQRMVNALHLENRVRLLGYRMDVPLLMKVSDVYVTCSRREGLSRTVSEAMASGLPCIVSNRRGMKDLIKDGVGGYLIEPLDARGLAEKLDMLLDWNQEKRRSACFYNQRKIRDYTSSVVKEEVKSVLCKADKMVSNHGTD